MANNRDRDKQQYEQEETEYHFSDDEVTYEAEPEEQIAPPKSASSQPAANRFFNDWSTRKRLGLSVIAFCILLFIVYKIVSPGGHQEITPVASTVEDNTQARAIPKTAPDMSRMPTATVPPAAQTVQPSMPQPVTTAIPQAMNMPVQQQPSQPSAPTTTINQMPPVMPVTSTPPPYPASSQTVENGANQLVAINNQLVAQMQSEYAQKLAAMTQQNKQLEDEIQKLNASVTSIEARMNQLVQLMVKQQAENQQAKEASPVQTAAPQTPKLPYTVQAIIPGRAWLRADNGDTLTVTEGDTIKDIGKVTKIDPYDGVIEINTGRKVISLSYGNGG